MVRQVFVNMHAGVHGIFWVRAALHKKQISSGMNTDDADFKFKIVLLSFFDSVNQRNQCYQR